MNYLQAHYCAAFAHSVPAYICLLYTSKKLLRGEGNEDGGGSGGQCALDGNEVICQRQAAHKALFLQIIQTVQSAVELLSDASSLKHSTCLLYTSRCV